ncbi:unnamed protein product [Heligmosomoides polygyrus]|uniref:Transmembrane protein n=1 Tax=Heligmosomoides polygyrus TaxID=6339 RepID=A0A3P7WUW0_HELPZ|nr:unnamed protein product [Heligmosomoides polygyrus]
MSQRRVIRKKKVLHSDIIIMLRKAARGWELGEICATQVDSSDWGFGMGQTEVLACFWKGRGHFSGGLQIIYDSEWRLEQLYIESITVNVINIADERNTLSTQVDAVLDVQTLSLSDVTDIVTEYVTTSFPTESAIPPLDYDTKHWTYPSSTWFVICLVMSLDPMTLTVNSPVTIITSLYLKLAGPAISVIVIASMASTMNWILYLLTLCIARKPSYLPDALTAKYQSNLVVRDSLIMLLTVVIFLGTLALGAYLYSIHGRTDYVFALKSVIKLLTSSTISEENVETLTKVSGRTLQLSLAE